MNFEVINPYPWGYEVVNRITIRPADTRYQIFATGAWVSDPQDVYLRVALIGYDGHSMGLRVDDLSVISAVR